jgi:multiple antibiotic resistance protein
MRGIALAAFAIFFVTVAPLKNVPVFAALTQNRSVTERRWIALRASLFAAAVLTVFSVFGDDLLRVLGITLPAVRIGGGVLLMLMAIQMVFATPGGIFDERQAVQQPYADVAVFPIAMPLVAGPGTITAVIMLMSDHQDVVSQLVIYAMLLVVLLATLLLFLVAGTVAKALGDSAMTLISRVMGILLMALAAEFVVQGVRDGLLR